MRCPNCDAEVPEGEKFCPQCGVPMEGAVKCPYCGAAMLPDEQFCGQCGREVKRVAPPGATVVAPLPGVVPPAVATAAPKKRSPWIWVGAAVGLVAILACSGVCLFTWIIPALRATPTPTSPPPPPTPVLATMVPPTQVPTSTPVPTDTPTPGPQAGALIYEEDFVAPGSEWEVKDAGDAVYAFDGEAYSIQVNKANWMAWNVTKGNYSNFLLEFDVTLVEGDVYNAYGVLVCFVDKNNYYELDINGNQSYSVGIDIDGEWTQLVSWTTSEAIRPLGETNQVRLMAYDGTFSLYVNDQFVGDYIDSTFTSGDIAPVVTAYDTPPARATFDNIKVWQLQAP